MILTPPTAVMMMMTMARAAAVEVDAFDLGGMTVLIIAPTWKTIFANHNNVDTLANSWLCRSCVMKKYGEYLLFECISNFFHILGTDMKLQQNYYEARMNSKIC